MPFRSTTIRTKLIATFSVVTVFILAISMLGITGVNQIDGLLMAVQTNWLPSVRTTAEIDVSMARYTTSLLRATQTTDTGDFGKIEVDLAKRRRQVAERSDAYEPLISSPEERALHDTFHQGNR